MSWTYSISTTDEWLEGKVKALLREISRVELAEEMKVTVGPAVIGTVGDISRLWATYRDEDGDIYVARSDEDWGRWEYTERITESPIGSTNPSIAFDQDGNWVVAVEYLPAGATQKEIWLIDYPYDENNVNKTADGQYPVLGNDIDGVVYLFYQSTDTTEILYRKSDEDYDTAHTLPYSSQVDMYPKGYRLVHEPITQFHDKYIYVIFFDDGTLRYYRSEDDDRYTVGIDLLVVNPNGIPAELTDVVFGGETARTNLRGEAEFLYMPYAERIDYEINGHKSWTEIPGADKGTRIGLIVQSEPHNETIKPSADVGITWQPIIYATEEPSETIMPSGSIGIDWEVVGVDVEFTIVDSNCEPVENATVEFYGESETTDENGKALFESVTGGTHSFKVTEGDRVKEGEILVVDTNVFVHINIDGYVETISPSVSLDIEWIEMFYETEEPTEQIIPAGSVASILWVDQS